MNDLKPGMLGEAEAVAAHPKGFADVRGLLGDNRFIERKLEPPGESFSSACLDPRISVVSRGETNKTSIGFGNQQLKRKTRGSFRGGAPSSRHIEKG